MSRQLLTICALSIGLASTAFAQQPPAAAPQGGRGAGAARVTRPALFFKEEWKQTDKGGEHPIVFDSTLSNPNLELKVYGPSSKELLLTGDAGNDLNPIHVWTGMCTTPCAVAFRHKTAYADLSGLARLRWNTKVSGFHQIRPIVKLADGTWLVGDQATGPELDFNQRDVSIADLRWLKLDIARVVAVGNWVEHPDLTKVDEVGFADLMPGSGHGPGGYVNVGRLEVYGRPVKR